MTRNNYFNLIDKIVNEWDGKKLDVDNAGAGSTGDNCQCVDVVKQVVKEVIGKVIQFDVVNWKNILNYTHEIPQSQVDKGDIFLWVNKHTGIGLGKFGEGKGTFEQNSPIGSPCQKKAWRTQSAELRWFRVNGVEDPEPQAMEPAPVTDNEFYPKPIEKAGLNVATSIVDALKSIGVDSSFEKRALIAQKNGVVNSLSEFLGAPSQNIKLLELLKNGNLKRV
jgi:hypothetical protein